MVRLDAWPAFRALSAVARGALERVSVARSFAAGAHLLEAGARAEWVHLVTRGLVREYYVTGDGEEHTRSFVAEGGATGSLLDLLSGAPAVTWIQALERTETIAWRFDAFRALSSRHPELESLARANAEALAVRKTRREHDMLALDAAARLARWRADHPGLDARITRRMLASYLGITPVHLSRITRARRGTARRPR